MIRVLIADLGSGSAGRLAEALQAENAAALVADGAEQALGWLGCESPDAVVLSLASGVGWELDLCREIRERTTAPLLVVGKEGQEPALARSLDAGGDAHIVEPFAKEILLSQLYALLRRVGFARATSSGRYDIGTLAIDVFSRDVRVRGNEVELSLTEFEILRCLLNNSGRVLSYRTLVRQVQGLDCSSQEARRLLKVHIHKLRQKIEPVPRRPVHILNVRGFGYLFERRRSRRDTLSEAIS